MEHVTLSPINMIVDGTYYYIILHLQLYDLLLN